MKAPAEDSWPGIVGSVDGVDVGLRRIQQWAAIPFSKGSSSPRDQTRVSHIVDNFFTIWVTGKSYPGNQ